MALRPPAFQIDPSDILAVDILRTYKQRYNGFLQMRWARCISPEEKKKVSDTMIHRIEEIEAMIVAYEKFQKENEGTVGWRDS
jgi:hypothetical protein